MIMSFEIDFLQVGTGNRSGDAIALRYSLGNNYKIHVIDGGDLESGEHMVKHIKDYYGNPSIIDSVVCTHGDEDHCSGLRKVIEHFQVNGIWINRPWKYVNDLIHYILDQRITLNSFEERLRDKFSILNEIECLANDLKIPLYDAFQGTRIGPFLVLSPSRERYLHLIPKFLEMDFSEILNILNHNASVNRTPNLIQELFNDEILQENVATSASNESSIVQIAQFYGKWILLTGDAGIQSLNEAVSYIKSKGHPPTLDLIQIPHHGSRHNISPSILNQLLVGSSLHLSNTCAIASVAKKTHTHPNPQVVNALIRRGCKVFSTQGSTLRYSINMPARYGWHPAEPHSFMTVFPEKTIFNQRLMNHSRYR